MREQLKQYVELLFAGAADADDVKEEILQNTLERYDDLTSQGKSPEAAYRLAISGIGDVNEILGGTAIPHSHGASVPVKEKTVAENSADSAMRKKMHAVAVALYITCVVPVIVFSEFGLETLGVVMMFLMVAAATALILMSRRDHADEDDRDDDDDDDSKPQTPQQELKNTVNALVNVLTLLVYLGISFATGAWYITWIIFPLAGTLKNLFRAIWDLRITPWNAIARIVLNAILVLLLLGVVGVVLGFQTYSFIRNEGHTVAIGSETSFSPEEVDDITIEWATGTITVVCADTDEITVSEAASGSNAKPLVYSLEGGELQICFAENIRLSSITSPVEKDLTVTVPLDFTCERLRIDAASADIRVQELTMDTLELNCASGTCVFSNCHADNLDLDGAACKVDYTGTFYTLNCDGAAAEIVADCLTAPHSIDIDGASASLELSLPEDTGFCVDMDGMSCSFSSDFDTRQRNGCHVYGNEECIVNVDGMSASVYIRNGGHTHSNDCYEDNGTCPDNTHHNGGHY